jgi:hypothetical protein
MGGGPGVSTAGGATKKLPTEPIPLDQESCGIAFRSHWVKPKTCILYTIALAIVNVEVVEKYEIGGQLLQRCSGEKD